MNGRGFFITRRSEWVKLLETALEDNGIPTCTQWLGSIFAPNALKQGNVEKI